MTDLEIPEASVYMMPFEYTDAFARLRDETQWTQTYRHAYGRKIATPRLTAWYGDPGAVYTYSTIKNDPLPWNPLLNDIRSRVEDLLQFKFNSVLLNYYRDGRDSIDPHADDERSLGPDPVIASLSFGDPRVFVFQHKRKRYPDFDVELEDQSLLLMMGSTQTNWLHGIAKTKRAGERINLTFRRIVGVKPSNPND